MDTPEFEVLREEDVSFAAARRYSLDVLIEPGTTRDGLVPVGRGLADKWRRDKGHQAFNVGFHDYREFVGHGYPLGFWRHVPWGDWARAMDVTLGDYSVFVEDSNMLREKDWAKRPELDEVRAWEMWHRIQEPFDQLLNPLELADTESWAGQYVANEFGWSEETVRDAVIKVVFWVTT